jgi:hypothetical protein
MYTFIKNNQLHILNHLTGKIYRVGLSLNGQEVRLIPVDTLQYQADVHRYVAENDAKAVFD